ncbi:hypothetical protein AF335_08885 [Streptomyces eurocidicus]|uniref:DUF4386 family protein n=1 Tax=Streptomyces eurocidicus TaxID=66423 RepID=A0A2N8P0U2_STREU|nr:hypothetical protein [Streptomyces eurocidicus]MBB5122938.1 hypothetical protein [Streptomyces eurocidicus]MBF6055020.1 hypothetical protein [Streptomyces eurocidicus]PNE34640.1 hypothetical protein AF335_08885 [Streptomyces eurocidicus]
MSTDKLPRQPSRLQTNHVRYLRWAAFASFTPLISFAMSCSFGKLPWPDSGGSGREQLDYALKNYCAEWQAWLWFVQIAATTFILLVFATVYLQRAGRLTLPGLTLTGFAAASMGSGIITGVTFLVIGQLGRGYPGYGADPWELGTVETLWLLTNAFATVTSMSLGLAFIALMFANRADPVLPIRLTHWGAVIAATVTIGWNSISMLFITSGLFSPSSFGSAMFTYGAVLFWIMAIGGALLYRSREPALSR